MPHSELNQIKIIPVFVVLAFCTMKIDHIRARAIDHSVLFSNKAKVSNCNSGSQQKCKPSQIFDKSFNYSTLPPTSIIYASNMRVALKQMV